MNEEILKLREENKRLKEQLTGRKDLLIADSIPSLVAYVDCDLRYVFVNKAYEKWFKQPASKIQGKYVKDLVGDAVFSKALPYFRRAIEGESVDFEEEAHYAEGTRFIHVHYIPDKALDGRVQGFITHVIDITARKLLEKSQQDELNRMTTLLEEAPVSIALLTGPDHKYFAANKNYRDAFFTENSLGKTAEEVFPMLREQGFIKILDEVYQTGKPFSGKEVPYFHGEKNFYLNFVYQAVKNSSDEITGVLAVITDVTDEVRVKKELLEQRDIRERFVSTLSHDLNTPLTAAKMSAQLILRKASDYHATLSLGNRILTNLNRAETMVRDLLDVNLINAGGSLPIAKEELDLNNLIDETLLDFMAQYEGRFKFIKHDHSIEGFWDPSALRRVLENLISNAIKYGAPDSIITISSALKNGMAEFDIHNLGHVIRPAELENLFVRYRRLDSAIESGKAGWGIGLSLVKGLVEAHGGSVYAESNEKEGTNFKVIIPLR